jgi:hypothetical protein
MVKKIKADILKRILVTFSRIEMASQSLSDERAAPQPDRLQILQWEKLRSGFEAELFEMLQKGDSKICVLKLYALLHALNQTIDQQRLALSDEATFQYYLSLKTRCSKDLFDLLTPLRLDFSLAA